MPRFYVTKEYLERTERVAVHFYPVPRSQKANSSFNPFSQKTDIFIKINNIKKRISIKSGIKNSVHVEPISEFIHFLIENNIEKKYIISYLKYHYADGTTNGSGIKRVSISEYKAALVCAP